MASEAIRNPHTDWLLSPDRAALIPIDYQPAQVPSIRSIPPDELGFDMTGVAKAAIDFGVLIIHSPVDVRRFDGFDPKNAAPAPAGRAA